MKDVYQLMIKEVGKARFQLLSANSTEYDNSQNAMGGAYLNFQKIALTPIFRVEIKI